jgi:alkylation response protein AidB-like acyl-CoA dehydrogenase
MDFSLTEDQKMITETVTSFVKKESPVERMRGLRDDERGWDPKVWAQMGELGWLSIPFPESVGGFGGSMVDVGLILEQLGTTLVPEPYIASVVLGGMAVLHAGTPGQQERVLTPMIGGETSLALAYAERQSRYDLNDCVTKAEEDGGGWRLTGEKVFVLNGQAADTLVVSARVAGDSRDADGIRLFLVDPKAEGVRVQNVKTMDGGRAATITMEGAQGAELLGDANAEALPILEHVLDKGAAAACAEGLGVISAVHAMTVEYLKTRKQFGVPIGVFQALQHRSVDMFVQVELCRGTAILATAKADETDAAERQRAISIAKAQLSQGGFFVVAEGTQLHGGIGVTDEHDMSLYFKKLRVLTSLFGDEDHHVERFMTLPSFTAGM